MHQLYQQQQCGDNNIEMSANTNVEEGHEEERETSLTEPGQETELTIEASLNSLSLGRPVQEMMDEAEEANMWTRKDINEFKDTIRKEESDAIIKIGHGETVTVRVPTHVDGKSLYWEFATDSYDLGFGLFFEWVEPEDTQVIVI